MFGLHPAGKFIFGLLFIILLPVFLCHCAQQWNRTAPMDAQVPVKFQYFDPTAKEVCVAGSFNQWSQRSHCMSEKEGLWSLSVPLTPGRYQYVLVIDGKSWRPDPGAILSEDNGFDGKNSVLIVE
jgi:1,4-alpha-glucan branching enzyme